MRPGLGVIVLIIIFTALAAVFVVARCIARFGILKNHGWEDFFIIGAMVMSMALTVLAVEGREHGAGSLSAELSAGTAEIYLKILFSEVVLYFLIIAAIKISIFAQYLRFVVEDCHRRFCWILIGFNVAYTLGSCVGFLLSCRPLPYFWNKQMHGTCEHYQIIWYTNAAFDFISDLLLVAFPVAVFGSLNMPTKQKHQLIFVFAVGGVGCITAALRIYGIWGISHTADHTREALTIDLWSCLEVNIGIICSCFPMIRPVVKLILPGLVESTRRMSVQVFGSRAHMACTCTTVVEVVEMPTQDSPGITARGGSERDSWEDGLCRNHGTSYDWVITGGEKC